MSRLALLLLACFITACGDRTHAPAADAPAGPAAGDVPAATTPPGAPPVVPSDAGQPRYARYACSEGHMVAVVGDEARVTLGDGREIRLTRDGDTGASSFTGEALAFRIADGRGELTQDERITVRCESVR